ncbi:MAG: cytochrome c [Gallionella sp.]|nr:cytochrome c [Gallionella sp.]
MKLLTTLLLLCAANAAQANPFPTGNAQTGKALFDKYNCNSCHAAMLGSDGNSMFTRENRKVNSPDKLIEQIKQCSGNVGANLTKQDEQHLGAYLNQYYKLK